MYLLGAQTRLGQASPSASTCWKGLNLSMTCCCSDPLGGRPSLLRFQDRNCSWGSWSKPTSHRFVAGPMRSDELSYNQQSFLGAVLQALVELFLSCEPTQTQSVERTENGRLCISFKKLKIPLWDSSQTSEWRRRFGSASQIKPAFGITLACRFANKWQSSDTSKV